MSCNLTLETVREEEDNIVGNFTLHELSLIVSGSLTLVASSLTFFLAIQHTLHYSKPHQQRHVLRILMMVPIYSFVSFLCVLFYKRYVYFTIIINLYESIALVSFFSLICNYVAPSLREQKNFFRAIQPAGWALPLSWLRVKAPRSGLTWFNIVWLLVFQYCLIRSIFTIASIVTEALHIYCQESLSPLYFHIWATVFTVLSTIVAMFSLAQLYKGLKEHIKNSGFIFKLTCIKIIVFLTFWQGIIIPHILEATLPESPKVTFTDSEVILPHVIFCAECAIFACLNFRAYPCKEFVISASGGDGLVVYQGGLLGWRAWRDAINILDLFRAVGRSLRWLFIGSRRRYKDVSYAPYLQRNGSTDTDAIPLSENAGSGIDVAVAENADTYQKGYKALSTVNKASISRPY